MSGFGAPGGRAISFKPSPPEKGSFPLDHDAECKHLISSYLRCLKSQSRPGTNSEECRMLAKGYLDCRMERGLMAKDEWANLGLVFEKNGESEGNTENTSISTSAGASSTTTDNGKIKHG